MKILLPCPACQRPLSPPRQASLIAQLRCSHCGHLLAANSILVDNSELDGTWEVVEDTGSDNAFAPFYASVSSVDSASSPIEFDEAQDVSAAVPQSNEWETQPSANAFEESIETDAQFQIASDHLSAENVTPNNFDPSEVESFEDRMIGVSDEPWFSLNAEEPKDGIEESAEHLVEDESEQPEMLVDFLEQEEEPVEVDFSEEPISGDDETPSIAPSRSSKKVSVVIDDGEEPFETLEESAGGDPSTKPMPVDLLGTSKMRPRVRKKSSPLGMLFSIFGGGVASIPIAILLMWYWLGKDPLEAGPAVANYAPWIVPEAFRGSGASNLGQLPSIPSSPQGSFPVDPSTGSRKFPSIGGGSMAAQTPSEPEPTLEATPMLNESEASTPPVALDASLAIAPTMIPSNEVIESIDPNALISAAEKFERTVNEFEAAIAQFDEKEPATSTNIFLALETLGEIIAAQRLKNADWQMRANKACESIVANKPILLSLQNYLKSDRSDQYSDDIAILKPIISEDFVQIESIKQDKDHDVWQIKQRFEKKVIKELLVVVPHFLEIKAKPNDAFLIVGIAEEYRPFKKHVFRVLAASQKK